MGMALYTQTPGLERLMDIHNFIGFKMYDITQLIC